MSVRKATVQIQDALENGTLSYPQVVEAFLTALSEDQILDIAEAEGLIDICEDDENIVYEVTNSDLNELADWQAENQEY